MESDANSNLYFKQQQFNGTNNNNNNQNNNSGLLRFRSAPTSLLENCIDEKTPTITDSLITNSSSSRLCSSDQENNMYYGLENSNNNNKNNKNVINRFAAVSSSQLPPQYPRPSTVNHQLGSFIIDNNGGDRGSMSMDHHHHHHHHQMQGKLGNFILMRQNSSPPGWFNAQNGPLSGITEFRNGNEEKVGNISSIDIQDSFPWSDGLPFASSWNDDSSNFGANLMTSGIKRELDIDHKLFASSNTRINMETNNSRLHILSHHLSLPAKAKSSGLMSSMCGGSTVEKAKILQLQNTVPCKIRAKRGCATHPRSIAERVRRTRISERMRKLQELVPNMDKQTNTADMLDLAVECIKSLQKQYKTLSDSLANCRCSASEILDSNDAYR